MEIPQHNKMNLSLVLFEVGSRNPTNPWATLVPYIPDDKIFDNDPDFNTIYANREFKELRRKMFELLQGSPDLDIRVLPPMFPHYSNNIKYRQPTLEHVGPASINNSVADDNVEVIIYEPYKTLLKIKIALEKQGYKVDIENADINTTGDPNSPTNCFLLVVNKEENKGDGIMQKFAQYTDLMAVEERVRELEKMISSLLNRNLESAMKTDNISNLIDISTSKNEFSEDPFMSKAAIAALERQKIFDKSTYGTRINKILKKGITK